MKRHALVQLAMAALLFGAVAPAACSRQADIVDEPDAVAPKVSTFDPDADIPILDAGLASDAFPACEERPMGACKGHNDFACGFVEWAREVARTCQYETGCKTNGWLTVKMGGDGCVTEIGMDQPNEKMVACLLQEYGSVNCPCGVTSTTYYFGDGNAGVCPDGGRKG